jgi:hypothetical protein
MTDTTIHKFHDIESLRHIAQSVAMHCEYYGIAVKPIIEFCGTVKLHGTNAGVRVCSDGSVLAQGRNRELTLTSDNYGFAHFVSGRKDFFKAYVAEVIGSVVGDIKGDVTLYGEWCGQGIQAKVGVSKLPKMFVIFGALVHDTNRWIETWDLQAPHMNGKPLTYNLPAYNAQSVYFINQAPTYKVLVDFNDPTPAAEQISQYTLQVEDMCPFAHLPVFAQYHKGENIGVGEGIVWVAITRAWGAGQDPDSKRLVFKSKGEKHKKGGEKLQVSVNPEKVSAVAALVDLILPEWRLEQGITYLKENNIPLANTSTGQYLKWIAQDILKEESDRIAANPYPWKEIQGTVMNRSKDYFMTFLNTEAGL